MYNGKTTISRTSLNIRVFSVKWKSEIKKKIKRVTWKISVKEHSNQMNTYLLRDESVEDDCLQSFNEVRMGI